MQPVFLAFPNDEPPWLLTRAYMAAIVGPSRTAGRGQTRKYDATPNTAVRLSHASGNQVLFVAVRMVTGQLVAYGPDENLGAANSVTFATGVVPFNQVLLPGESLWAMNAGGLDQFVVTEVRF